MTLDRLLMLAGLNRYQRFTYFSGCRLQGPVIWHPDATLAKVISVAWLPQIRLVLSDCEVRVGIVPTVERKTAYRGQAGGPGKYGLDF